MKRKFPAVLFRRLVFLCLAALMLFRLSAVLERKTVQGPWNYFVKVGGFRNEPENSFDLLCFGSSHMYCTLSPVSLYQQTGLRSYVLATQQQPVDATFYYIREALKTQQPRVILVEALMFLQGGGKTADAVAHDAIDPFPHTLNRLRMIYEMNVEGNKESYYVNLVKYHTRWKSLTSADYSFAYREETDPCRGFVLLTSAQPNNCGALSLEGVEETPLDPEKLQTLLEIQALAEEAGAELLLLAAPYCAGEQTWGAWQALHRFARENGVDFLDLNVAYDELGLENETDFYDSGHLNVFGAEKVTAYIGDYVEEKYGLAPMDRGDSALWEEDILLYEQMKQS